VQERLIAEQPNALHMRLTWLCVRMCAQDLLFYQLPHHAQFYVELVNGLQGRDAAAAEHATVTVLYSQCDALRLEPIVGAARAHKMLKGASSTFLFC
jgi:U3 small nucleolar RNA-associated protein 25